jgi:hypothetical protein
MWLFTKAETVNDPALLLVEFTVVSLHINYLR